MDCVEERGGRVCGGESGHDSERRPQACGRRDHHPYILHFCCGRSDAACGRSDDPCGDVGRPGGGACGGEDGDEDGVGGGGGVCACNPFPCCEYPQLWAPRIPVEADR